MGHRNILAVSLLFAAAVLFGQEGTTSGAGDAGATAAPAAAAVPAAPAAPAATPAAASLAQVHGLLGVGVEYNHTPDGDFIRAASGMLDRYPNISALQVSFAAGPLSGEFKWATAFNDLYFTSNAVDAYKAARASVIADLAAEVPPVAVAVSAVDTEAQACVGRSEAEVAVLLQADLSFSPALAQEYASRFVSLAAVVNSSTYKVTPDSLGVYGYLYDAWAAVTLGAVQVKLGAITFDQYASFAYTEGNKPKSYGAVVTVTPLAGLDAALFVPVGAPGPADILDVTRTHGAFGGTVADTLSRCIVAARYAGTAGEIRAGLNLKSMGDHAWSALPSNGPTVWLTAKLSAVKDLALAGDLNLVQLGTSGAGITAAVSVAWTIGSFTPGLFAAAGVMLSPFAPALLIITPSLHYTGLPPLDLALTGTYNVISWEASAVASFAGIAPEVIKASATYRSNGTVAAGLGFVFMF